MLISFDNQSRTGVQYCGKARLLVPIVVSIRGCQLRTDGFRDRGGYVQHGIPHGSERLWAGRAGPAVKNSRAIGDVSGKR